MAAVITLTGWALASDGKTLTATIGGGTAPYSISSPAGIFPRIAGTDYIVPTATPTVSGTTLTVVLPTPFLSGQTVQITTTTASTITDSAANTISVASNQATTNSSTQTGATTAMVATPGAFNMQGAAHITGSGVDQGGSLIPSMNATDGVGYAAECVINVTSGTVDLDLYARPNAGNPMYYAVDAGAMQTFNGTNPGDFEFFRAASGLGTGKHVVRFSFPNQYYAKGIRLITTSGAASVVTVPCPVALMVDNAAGFTLTSQVSPAKRWGTTKIVSSRVTNSHPGFQLNIAGNFTGVEALTVSSLTQYQAAVAVDQVPGAPVASYTITGKASDSTLQNGYQMTTLVAGLTAGAHTVELLDLNIGTYAAVRVHNGSVLTSAASSAAATIIVADTTNIAAGDWLCVDTLQDEEMVKVSSISGTGPYTLTLSSNTAKAHASGATVRNLTPANTPTLTAGTKPTFNGRLVAIGDSLTHAAVNSPNNTTPAGFAGYDPRVSYAFIAARIAGYEFVGGATQGWTTAQMATDNASNNFDAGKPATVYSILAGTNDFGAGNTALATYESGLETIIGQAKTAAPSGAKILLHKIFSSLATTTNAGGKTKADYNAQQTTAVTNTQASGFTIRQTDIARSVSKATSGNQDVPDLTHPSWTTGGVTGTGGQNKMANEFLPHLTGYTLSLSAGTVVAGNPVTVTVALPLGATFVSGTASGTGSATADTVTLSDGGAGGSFGTLTLTPGATSASTTYTPASAGSPSISATNGQGWADPSAQPLTVTAAGNALIAAGFFAVA